MYVAGNYIYSTFLCVRHISLFYQSGKIENIIEAELKLFQLKIQLENIFINLHHSLSTLLLLPRFIPPWVEFYDRYNYLDDQQEISPLMNSPQEVEPMCECICWAQNFFILVVFTSKNTWSKQKLQEISKLTKIP